MVWDSRIDEQALRSVGISQAEGWPYRWLGRSAPDELSHPDWASETALTVGAGLERVVDVFGVGLLMYAYYPGIDHVHIPAPDPWPRFRSQVVRPKQRIALPQTASSDVGYWQLSFGQALPDLDPGVAEELWLGSPSSGLAALCQSEVQTGVIASDESVYLRFSSVFDGPSGTILCLAKRLEDMLQVADATGWNRI